jgi:hypothetical protein
MNDSTVHAPKRCNIGRLMKHKHNNWSWTDMEAAWKHIIETDSMIGKFRAQVEESSTDNGANSFLQW